MTHDKESCCSERKRIQALDPARLLIEILSHYKCPSSCNAMCCRNYEIPVLGDEILDIEERYPLYKDAMKKLESADNGFELYGEWIDANYLFTEKPCPLLTKYSKCGVQDVKPLSCKLFPFIVSQDGPDDEWVYKLDLCELGVNILTDYTGCIAQVIPEDIRDSALKPQMRILVNNLILDKTQPEKIRSTTIPSIEGLQILLHFLTIVDDKDVELCRKDFQEKMYRFYERFYAKGIMDNWKTSVSKDDLID